ncbi:MAG: hypothetical protein ACYC1C_17735 [Chloroflexota bacterium]
MISTRLLLWVRWRQMRGTVYYWLRVLGFDPQAESRTERLYLLYLLAIALGWLVLMWSYAAFQADTIGGMLGPAVASTVADAMSWLVLLLAAVLMIIYLRSTPFKIRLNDMTYIGSSPMSRRTPIALAYGGALAKAALIATPVAMLVALAVGRAVGADLRAAALQAALAGLLLSVLVMAVAWIVGLFRVSAYAPGRAYLLWLAPVLLVAFALVAPGVALWPAAVLGSSLQAAASEAQFAGLGALAVVALGGLYLVGGRVDMVAVAEESAFFGWGRTYGWSWPFGGRRVGRKLKGGRLAAVPPFPPLGPGRGLAAPLARSALSYARQPMGTLQMALKVASLSYFGAWIMIDQAPLPVWSLWLILALAVPPQGLVGAFQADLEEPFLRQLLPYGNLRLFLADVLVPFLLSAAAIALVFVVQSIAGAPAPAVMATALLIAALFALCQAVGMLKVPGLFVRVRYPLLALLSLGTLIALAIFAGSLATALAAGLLWCLVLAFGLAQTSASATVL